MALFDQAFRTLRMRTCIATMLAGSALTTPALAEFPDGSWNVPYVQVRGDAGQDMINTVNLGLTQAGQTFFYGNRATKMIANVRGAGLFDVQIVDGKGKVLATGKGLAFGGSGSDAVSSVKRSALKWMESLVCVDGCAVARAGGAPAPVQVAKAEPEATQKAVAPTVKTEPKPAIKDTPKVSEPRVVAAAQKPVKAATPKAPKPTATAEKAPKVKTPKIAEPTRVAKPAVPAGAKDADAVLAEASQKAEKQVAAKAPETPVQSKSPQIKLPQPRPDSLAAPKGTAQAEAPKVPTTTDKAPDQLAALTEPKPERTAPTAKLAADAGTEVKVGTGDAEAKAPTVTKDPAVQPAPKPAATATVEDKPTVAPADETPTITAADQPTPVAKPAEVETPEKPEATAAAKPPKPAEEKAPAITATEDATATPTLVNPAAPTETPQATQQTAEAEVRVPAPRVQQPAEAEVTEQPTEAAQPEKPVETAQPEQPAEQTDQQEDTQLAAVDPTAEGPTLANARWVGFTPAVYTGGDQSPGTWISGPFDRQQRTGWITDTATGATTRVKFIWREGGRGGRTAVLSKAAANALGLREGDVANVAVYLPR